MANGEHNPYETEAMINRLFVVAAIVAQRARKEPRVRIIRQNRRENYTVRHRMYRFGNAEAQQRANITERG